LSTDGRPQVPELPDVEVLKRYLDATSLHQRIEGVELRSRRLLEETSAQELASSVKGRCFKSTYRYGKHLFVELTGGAWLRLHFGMSGQLKYFKDMGKDPPYDRFLISFSNGSYLAYNAPRKLGHIQLLDEPGQFIQRKGLGPDALDPNLDLERFRELLSDRRGMIKPALMTQGIIAGIGNVYSDEILFQAGVHPRARIKELYNDALTRVFQAMKNVLETAIEKQADPQRFPDSFLTGHRHKGGECPLCGEQLERVRVSGRSAYYCPNRQGVEP
jgi:formamidopyrimidine-DNA glycosylase